LPAGAAVEVHLLLAGTGDTAQLLQVAQRFSPLGVDRAVFTKLDEAVGLGVVLNVASRLNLQLSYLTTGQDVPDDIEVGHRRRIAERLLQSDAAEPLPATPRAAPVLDHLA
jgi:flagellar biosynthesis protein FlhF